MAKMQPICLLAARSTWLEWSSTRKPVVTWLLPNPYQPATLKLGHLEVTLNLSRSTNMTRHMYSTSYSVRCTYMGKWHFWGIHSGTTTEFCVPDHRFQAAIIAKFRAFMQNPDHFFNFSGLLVVLSVKTDTNKLTQLRRHASQVHFAKIHFG